MDKNSQIDIEEFDRDDDNETSERPADDLLDILLDKNNRNPIVLSDEKGRRIAFEQVAIIPYDQENKRVLYVILKPLEEIAGVKGDEAIVFYVSLDHYGNTVLKVEEDEMTAIEIFNRYYDMLDEARGNASGSRKLPDVIKELINKRKGGNA